MLCPSNDEADFRIISHNILSSHRAYHSEISAHSNSERTLTQNSAIRCALPNILFCSVGKGDFTSEIVSNRKINEVDRDSSARFFVFSSSSSALSMLYHNCFIDLKILSKFYLSTSNQLYIPILLSSKSILD